MFHQAIYRRKGFIELFLIEYLGNGENLMKIVKALRGCNGFLFNCSTRTFGGPDDSIEKGDTAMVSIDFPSVLRIRWVATSQAFLPETKRETKLKDRARNCYNTDCCFFNGIKQVGLQKSREEIS